jgi:hypothetical protein
MLQSIFYAAAVLGAQSLGGAGLDHYSSPQIAPLSGHVGGVALGIDDVTRVVGISDGDSIYLWESGETEPWDGSTWAPTGHHSMPAHGTTPPSRRSGVGREHSQWTRKGLTLDSLSLS